MTIKNKRWAPTLLTLIFVIPMLAAWFAYSHGLFISGQTTNRGTLITPPINIAVLSLTNDKNQPVTDQLHGKWWLVYLTQNPQDSLSLRNLYYMRQIRQATGKNRDRVERAVITLQTNQNTNQWLASHFPQTALFRVSSEKIAYLESATKKLALTRGSLYLVDPLGNIMMFYAPDAAPKGILKDLERVLKVSQIG
jgi:cytochrome oxidase Cu insertion factor (SCO1/SenC/PrrC family)